MVVVTIGNLLRGRLIVARTNLELAGNSEMMGALIAASFLEIPTLN